MRTILGVLRLLLIFAWSLALQGCRLVAAVVARGDEMRDRRYRRWWFRLWARGFLRIAGFRVQVHGTPPQPPCLLVANHFTYMDIVVLASVTGYVFAAMADISRWPLLGAISRSLYVVFVDRKDKSKAGEVLPQIYRAFELDDGLIVFPEGKITRGVDVGTFKSPLVEPAFALNRPVACATLHYETAAGHPPAHRIIGWWRPEPLHEHVIRLLGYSGATAHVHFSSVPTEGLDRKTLAAALETEVRRSFQPHT